MLAGILGILMLVSLLPGRIAAATAWCDGWSVSGGAVISGGRIVLNSPEGSESIAQMDWNPGGARFDVEWKMTVNAFSGYENVQICTGTYRAIMAICSDKITYHAPDADGTGFVTGTVSYPIGKDTHTYRLIGDGNQCKLLIDGTYVQDFVIENNSQSAKLKVWNMGSSAGTANLIVESFVAHDVRQGAASPSADGGFYDTFDGSETGWMLNGGWEISGGYLTNTNYSAKAESVKKALQFSDEYTITFHASVPKIGANTGIQLFLPGKCLYISVKEKFLLFNTKNGYIPSENFENLGDAFHEYKIKGYNHCENAMIYLDGAVIADVELLDSTRTDYHIFFYNQAIEADNAIMKIDDFRFEPEENAIFMQSPVGGAVYPEGQPISLMADVTKDSAAIPSVAYQMYGNTVATGSAADGYAASIENLPPGNYEITPTYGERSGEKVAFTVKSSVTGSLDAVWNGSGIQISAALSDPKSKVSYVEYYIDGILRSTAAAAPYHAAIANVTAEAHTLTAVARNADGISVFQETKALRPSLTDGSASQSSSNEISYTVGGTAGSAVYELKNGNHRLSLRHTPDEVFYQTASGEKSYPAGSGSFTILTEGPSADVYFGGQLAFSFLMPQTAEIGQQYLEDGLRFTQKEISVPQNRRNYFVKRNVSDTKESYPVFDLSYIHNLDFVADKTDGARLVLNDGYYRTDISLEDGKFYVWMTQFDKSTPLRREVADAIDADDVYYRVETVAGMSRLYGNGKWLASFRNAHSTGAETLGVDITAGDGLRYLAVHDNTDLYLYRDDFKGAAEIPSADFYQTAGGMNLSVDTADGSMTLDAEGLTDAIAELTAYAGDASLSCDVNLSRCGGGFWFLLNHSVTNVYTKIGYNAATQNFEIVDRNNDDVTEMVKAVGTLLTDTTVHLELAVAQSESGKRVTLYRDGEAVITQNLTAAQRGKVGFILSDSTAKIYNLSYRGDTKPVTGVTDTVHAGKTVPPTLDLLERGNDLVMVSDSGQWMTSNNGGKDWEIGGTVGGSSYNMIRLSEKKTGNWSEQSKALSGTTGLVENGAVHLRFTPKAKSTMVEIYNGSYRFRLENEAGGTNRLCLYQKELRKVFPYPLAYGTTYDVIVFQRSDHYECWAKTAAEMYYSFLGKTEGMRDSTAAESVVIKANTTEIGGFAETEIDYIKIYCPVPGTTSGSDSTEADLLSTVDTAAPALVIDSNADFRTMVSDFSGTQGTEKVAGGKLLLKSGTHTGVERTNEVISVKRTKTGTDENGVGLYNYLTYYSTNNGASWIKRDGYLAPESVAGRITMNNRITQGKSGRVYFASCDNNNEDFGYTTIWYTDDKGVTWHKSETDLDAKVTGYCIQEVVCLETDEGIVRAYFRNNMGLVHYFNSYDYGVTWDLEHIYQTPFLSALNCFNIELDPYDMKTLYAAWGYDNANLHGIDQYPRTRWAFARSHDGGETWEFLGSVHENNAVQFSMMNLSVNVAKNYIVLNAYSDDTMNNDPQSWSRTIVVKKDQLKPTMDFEQLHMYDAEQIQKTRLIGEDLQKSALLIHPKSHSAVLSGDQIENAVYDGAICLEVAAAFVGAEAERTDGNVKLTVGDAAVSFAASEISVRGGRSYIPLQAFAERFHLSVTEENGTLILSSYDGWSAGQRQTLRTAVDLFGKSPTERDAEDVISETEEGLLAGMNREAPALCLDTDAELAPMLPQGDTTEVTEPDQSYLHGDGSSAKAEGGLLKLAAAAENGTVNCVSASDPDFRIGDIAHLRFTYHGGNCVFEIRSGGNRMRLNTGEAGSNIFVTGSGGYTNFSGTASVIGTTYDYIILNTENGFSYWRSTDRIHYTYLGTTAGKEASDGAYVRFHAAAGATMDVDFLKIYRPLGDAVYDMLESGAVVREFMQFDESFNGRKFMGTVVDGSVAADFAATDERGLALTADRAEDGYPGRWSKRTTGFSPLANTGDAVELSAMVPESGQLTVELDDGNGHVARFYVFGSGTYEMDGTTETVVANDATIAGAWNTYLIRNEGTCYGLYIKQEGQDSFCGPILKSRGKRAADSPAGGVSLIGGSGIQHDGAQAYVKDYKIYSVGGVSEEDTKTENAIPLYKQEFTDAAALAGDKVLAVNRAVIQDGDLQLTTAEVDRDMGQYRVSNLAIPAGGYAELRFRTDAPLKLKLFAPDTEFQIGFANQPNSANCTDQNADGGWQYFDGYTFEPNQYQNCRIVRSADGAAYDVYMKKDGGQKWLKTITGAVPRGNGGKEPTSLLLLRYGVGTAASNIDALRIYGPDKSLTLTDGRDVPVTPQQGVPLSYPGELRAVVGRNAEGVLVFAGYAKSGALVKVQTETITDPAFWMGSENQTYLFDGSADGIEKIKVFLWNGFGAMVPCEDHAVQSLTVRTAK